MATTKSLQDITAECKERNWKISTTEHDKGSDFVRVMFHRETADEDGMPEMVHLNFLFNTCTGRFSGFYEIGCTNYLFDSNDPDMDKHPWFIDIMDALYIPMEINHETL